MDCTLAPSNSHWELDLYYKGLRQENDLGGEQSKAPAPALTGSPLSLQPFLQVLEISLSIGHSISVNDIQLSHACSLEFPLSFPTTYPHLRRGILSRDDFCCCDKTLISGYRPQCITGGGSSGGLLLTVSLPVTYSACFLIQPWTKYPEVEPLTVGWVLLP